MRRSFLALSLAFVCPFANLPQQVNAQTPVDPLVGTALQQKLDSCHNVYNVPGISVTLLLPGDRFWNGTTGVSDIYSEEPLDTFHVFQGASMTKLFVATIVLQLIEEGVLALDDSIGQYLAPITDIPSNTRIRYLLNHRSGLEDFLADDNASLSWFSDPDYLWEPVQVLETFLGEPLFVQNTGFSYSNTNYVLLGILIEQVTGHTFEQELQDRILTPLGLEHTFFPPTLPVLDPLTPGWSSWQFPNTYDTDVTDVIATNCFASMAFTAGALVATPWDVAHFTRAVMTGALLSPASLTTMRTCTNVSFGDGANGYGHGTMRYTIGGRTYFGHAGDISGFTQMTIHSEQDSVTLTLSMNRNGAPRGTIAAALLSTLHQWMNVGVPEVEARDIVFDLYPIPASDRVHLVSDLLPTAERIEVINVTGLVVLSMRPSSNTIMDIDVADLASGMYQVRLVSPHGSSSRPLIVE